MRERLLVIGNGMAGARTVEEILERNPEAFEITVFGEEPHGNYNRISLSNLLAGSEDPRDIFLNPLEWYEENGVKLYAGARVGAVDRFAKTLTTDDGAVHEYDQLILATGSRSWIPPVENLWQDDPKAGALKPGAFGFRTMHDCFEMLAWAENASRVAIVGGGLLGLEAARGLLGRGLHATIVHRAGRLMNVQLDDQAARMLQAAVEKMGIDVLLEKSTVSVAGEDQVEGVRFDDGSELECDMIVFATGIRPNIDLAAQAGLEVERAIVVDDAMRVLDEQDVWAVGECCQHRGQVYGLVAPLWEQATVLADRITGINSQAEYHGSKIATKLKVSGVELATMGLVEPEHPHDEVVCFSEPKRGVYKTVIVRDGKLVGATILGDMRKVSFLMQAYDRGTVLPEERVELLFDLGGPREAVSVAELPDDAQVCNCNGVTKGAIRACVASGEKTLRGVVAKTRAGSGCGSCKAQVGDIIAWAAGGEIEEDPAADWYVPSIPMSKSELMQAVHEREIRSVSELFAAFTGGLQDAKAKPALASLLRLVWGAAYVDERDARFINDRVHANIQKDGTFSVVPKISGGVTSASQLRRIADVVDRYQIPMVKITGGQRIDLLGVPKNQLPAVWKDLEMPSGYAYGKSFRTVKTCVGSEFCRFGVGNSTRLGVTLEETYKGLESPAKLKLAVAGCPRNCSEAMIKDIGFVAVEGARWEMYVGGAGGSHVRKGDLLCTLDTEHDAVRMTGRFIQFYRENARWLERTYTFMERVGVDEVRAVVVADRDGIGAELDARMRKSIDAYCDPWLEALNPATPNQFLSVVAST